MTLGPSLSKTLRPSLSTAISGTGASEITDIEAWAQARGASMVFYAEGTNFQALKSWADGDELTGTNHWSDESGNTRDANPQVDTASNRPLYRDGTTTEVFSNGKPVIEFDGNASASHGLDTTHLGTLYSNPHTILSVGRSYGYEALGIQHDGAYDGITDDTKAALAWPQNLTTGINRLHTDTSGGAQADNVDAFATNAPCSYAVVYDANRRYHVNGKELTAGTGFADRDFAGLILGAKNTGGAEATKDGWLGFVAAFPGTLSTSDVEAFARWATRYGCPDWSTGIAPAIRQREVIDQATAGVSTSALFETPTQGDLMLIFAWAGTGNHAAHSITGDAGSAWTKEVGLDYTGATMSVWYKTADASQDTTFSFDNGQGAGANRVEIVVVEGGTSIVQSRAVDAGVGTSIAHAFSSATAGTGNLCFTAVTSNSVNIDPASAWTGGWAWWTNEDRMLTAIKRATATTEAGTVTVPSDDHGYIMVEVQ